MYHGTSESAISSYGTVDYYNKVARSSAARRTSNRLRASTSCPACITARRAGPNQFDMLTQLENWIERGTAPQAVVATHKTNDAVDRTRPLCPYPQVAKYTGTGSIDDAANFRCVAPEEERRDR
jgi:feruloyl esterase